MAGVSQYIKLLSALMKNGRSLMCPFCGAYTISINNQGICHICENVISSDRAALMKNESSLCASLDDYNKGIAGSDFDSALKTYDSILAKYPTPNYTYVKALTYISYSNFELSKIRYDLPGFMEENSVHREAASKLFSSARLFFNKAIFDAEKVASQPSDQHTYNLDYIMFLSAIKLGDLAGAKSYLNMLKSSGNPYLSAYAEIVFDSNVGDFKALLSAVDSMLKSKNFPISIFYYASYALLKLGKHDDSEKLSRALGKTIGGNTIASLNAYANILKQLK
ncbi:MAG: hypothetical protein QXW10_00625 [Candidatus Micrarchaeaceae archaeon]